MTAGGLLVKKLVVAAALAALALVGWKSWRGGAPADSAEAQTVPAAELVEAPAPVAEPREPVASEPAARTAVPAADAGADPALARADTATLTVHVTYASDGSDAAGIGLVLWPSDDPLAELHARFAESDASGRARLAGVAPGALTLHSDRETSLELELAPGEEREVALVLPAGIDVVGRVVDGADVPVPDAEIWLEGDGTGSRGGRIVARSDRAGRFALRALDASQALGAFAPGFAPAFLEKLDTKDVRVGEVAITLVLDRAGFELRGRVVDPAGVPVAGARVALGTRGNRVGPGRIPGVSGWRPRARMLVATEDGDFRAWIGLDARMSSIPLHVQAPGFALARLDVEEQPGPGETHVVRLEVGATIEGVVRDAAGEPVAGAHVSVLRAGTIEFAGSPLSLPFARSASDGEFRLAHVPSGEVELVAGTDDPRVGCTEVRRLADGASERWDLVLGVSRAITGRVVDAAGAGLAGRGVLVRAGNAMSGVTSDAQGRFTFVPDGETEEHVFELISEGGTLDRVEGVRAGAEIVLVERPHAAVVTGGFTDRAGRALPGERLLAALRSEDADHFSVQNWLGELGQFEFPGVAPGRYRVAIQSGDLKIAESPAFTVAEGAVVELEWLESAPAPR
jgi:hypothetical protein